MSFCSNAQVINFPDVNFKNYLLSANSSNAIAGTISGGYFAIDTNNDGEIQVSEASNVMLNRLTIENTNAIDVTGIEYFSNLQELSIYNNDQLLSLDLSSLTNLTAFNIEENDQLHTIVTTGLVNAEVVSVANNSQLVDCNLNNLLGLVNLVYSQSSLNLDGLPFLRILAGNGFDEANLGNIQTVNLSNLPNLEVVFFENNLISTIALNNLPKLRVLWLSNNQLTEIDFSNLNHNGANYFYGVNNSYFRCDFNSITSLDFSNTTFLHKQINNNQLEYLNIKDGVPDFDTNDGDIALQENPNLAYVCYDDILPDGTSDNIEQVLLEQGIINCVASTYCTFVPGGEYYTVEGNLKLDNEEDGCDENDTIFPNLAFSITNGSENGTLIANSSGNYFIPLSDGIHTLTPIFENPNYFTISPESIIVDFPTQVSPLQQNFCIVPNGIQNDLEIIILPNSSARPGFDVNYNLVFKNKGNTTLSGIVTFNFEDDKMDFVSSIPVATSQSFGQLTYDFTNLQPFEARIIGIVLNINSPMETPAVNGGDVLAFSSEITSNETDESPLDNQIELNQIVVNSFDPNDKTCVEGNTVGPEMIGQYVHYVIRFENTGTFPAENVVVKDMIDLTKFDLNTLIPVSSSHSYVTRIASDGKVEFIFENIQLPFDDDNNDGYIAFKIKTLSSLAIGDTFSNSANIYFDYNFPIETNTASTTIQTLDNSDFDFENYLTLYPNPVQNELNIKIKNDISIHSISIYNALGQLIFASTYPSESINVSNLKTGNYFLKVFTDKGISNSKFIKE